MSAATPKTASEWSREYHEALREAKGWDPKPPVYCPTCDSPMQVSVAYPLLLGPAAEVNASPRFVCNKCGHLYASAPVVSQRGFV